MRTRQLSDLQNDVLFQLDEVGSGKPAASDVTEIINQAWAKLYRRITNAGEKYYLTTQPLPVFAGLADYSLSNDFYKTVGLDVQISGAQWVPAHRMQFEQRNDPPLAGGSWPDRVLYDLWGNSLRFTPAPPSNFTCRHFYYPAASRISGPTETFDGIDGAEIAVVYLAAQRIALMLEQWELADRLGALVAAEWEDIDMGIRDRNVGEAPMARVTRGRPAMRTFFRSWWR